MDTNVTFIVVFVALFLTGTVLGLLDKRLRALEHWMVSSVATDPNASKAMERHYGKPVALDPCSRCNASRRRTRSDIPIGDLCEKCDGMRSTDATTSAGKEEA